MVVERMSKALSHRGPDDSGTWVDYAAGIALAQRRLAIVDLSPMGHQPMVSHCGRYVLVFNGEIYNHLALRSTLPAIAWRGRSDTETLLACIAHHGLFEGLNRIRGMFAFALWDKKEQSLTLARDRMGEKPLYWGHLSDGSLAFGSELRALGAHPGWQPQVDRHSLALLLRHGCIPAPYSIIEGVRKLEPASWLKIKANGQVTEGKYWNLPDIAQAGMAAPLALGDTQAIDQLEGLLTAAVDEQMLADVPLGAFLSGGVDSSTIVAMMTRINARKVRTFCIGFAEGATSEAAHARAVAKHLGTDHTELHLTGADALAVVPELPSVYDEPFADSSQIPTLLVARMARQHVTVALSGDAGDELFTGYNRYLIGQRLQRQLDAVPLVARQALARLALTVSPAVWDRLAIPLQALRSASKRHADVGEKVHKFCRDVLPASSAQDMHRALTSQWRNPGDVVLGIRNGVSLARGHEPEAAWRDPVLGMSLADQMAYLPDDILVKVDRAAMNVSLETRVPLLDQRIVEFAWRIPMHQRIRDGQTKWLLRQLLYRHVPRSLIERPKQGFAVPLDRWLRGPLREWAEAQLAPGRLSQEGFFDGEAVRRVWHEHLTGRRNHQHMLWNVLAFQAWLGSSFGQAAMPK